MSDKSTIHVLMIIDKSGSMYAIADDVRGGFNQYIEDLRQGKDDGVRYRVTVTLFDTEVAPLRTAAKLREVPRFDDVIYAPEGLTALLDAVGITVARFEQTTVLGPKDRVLVVVQTDGRENSSTEYSREAIAKMIRDREATDRWSFVFLGAGPDTWQQAGRLGFARGNTVTVEKSGIGTRNTYSGLSTGTRRYASGASGEAVAMAAAESHTGNVWRGDDQDQGGEDADADS